LVNVASRVADVLKNLTGRRRLQHPRQLVGHNECGRRIEEVQQVPAENAVDTAVGLRESLAEERGQLPRRSRAVVPIDVGEEILDEDLAAELLAEKTRRSAR
jgi:hypothetical protein